MTPDVFSSERAIQVSIIFSTFLGIPFLWQVYGVLPSMVFNLLAIGWLLFVADSVLTFVRPHASYSLGLILAVLALAVSLPQSAHYSFIANGAILPAITFITGAAAQFLIVALVAYRFVRTRAKDEWAWPGAK